MNHHNSHRSGRQIAWSLFLTLTGAFLVAYALEVFLVPNQIIDGGIIGVSILLGKLFGPSLTYPLVFILSVPFMALAYRQIGSSLLAWMTLSLASFGVLGSWINDAEVFQHYQGDLLEIVVIGGVLLGAGVGCIIRGGGCLDGTEILGILINKKLGFSVGSVILVINSFIFACAGLVFNDWHPAIQSMMTFLIAARVMDMVITGLDESKSLQILSKESTQISQALMHDLGLGLTILHGRGGYTGEKRDILYLVAERLQIQEIKNVVQRLDPSASVIVGPLQEVFTPEGDTITSRKSATT
ncbi:MAG: YitT family protein [Oligoflexales bacterium]